MSVSTACPSILIVLSDSLSAGRELVWCAFCPCGKILHEFWVSSNPPATLCVALRAGASASEVYTCI